MLTYASAISLQVLFALVPSLLAGVAVLGFLDLERVWSDTLAPRLHENVSQAVFEVIDPTVESLLSNQRGFWLTLGAALALWEREAAVQASGSLGVVLAALQVDALVRRSAGDVA